MPVRVGRLGWSLSGLFADGVYLVAWPKMAALAPPIALLLGLLLGTSALGEATIFTQSALLLSAAIFIGFVSAQLGLLFTIGYTLARLVTIEALRYSPNVFELASIRVAVVVAGVGLGMLAAVAPLLVRLLRARLANMPRLADGMRFPIDLTVGGVLAGVLTLLQLQALPMFVRPLFIWQGSAPPLASIAPVQQHAWLFVLVALFASLVRVVAEYVAAALDAAAIERYLRTLDHPTELGWWKRRPLPVRLGLAAAAGTLALSGLIMTWTDALLLYTGQVIIAATREQLARSLPVWSRVLERLPAAFRLLLALIASYVVMSWLLTDRLDGVSFEPVIWALLAALLCVALLFPPSSEPLQSTEERA